MTYYDFTKKHTELIWLLLVVNIMCIHIGAMIKPTLNKAQIAVISIGAVIGTSAIGGLNFLLAKNGSNGNIDNSGKATSNMEQKASEGTVKAHSASFLSSPLTIDIMIISIILALLTDLRSTVATILGKTLLKPIKNSKPEFIRS